MILTVSVMGTLVKRLSTSSELGELCGTVVWIMLMNSSLDLSMYLAGMYGFIISSSCLAVVYVGVVTWEMIGRSLFPGLCVFTFP